MKDAAFVSIQEGAPARAYHQFRGYLGRYPEDAEALKGYAQTIRSLDPQQQHDPSDLITIYQRILALEPKNHSVRLELMELYHRVNFSKEALELAALILEEDTAETRAREVRALQYARLRQYTAAISESKMLLEYEPEYVDIRLLLLQLMIQNNALDTEVVAWGGDLSKVISWDAGRPDYNPQSVTSRLVQGYAYQLVGQTQQAASVYKKLVSDEINDPKLIRMLAGLLDQVGLADEALALLTHATTQLAIADLRPDLSRMLWERFRINEMLTLLGEEPTDLLDDPGSFPFMVYGLYASGDHEKAQTLVKQGLLSEDPYIQAWSSVFSVSKDQDPDSAKRLEAMARVRDASERFPADAHLRAEYARQLLRSGFTEAAVAEWERVASDAPGWSLPMQQIAEIMLATQRGAMALEPARAAVHRAPHFLQGILVYFRAMSANLDRLSTDEFNRVRLLVDRVQSDVGSEALLPLRIELAARGPGERGREEALRQLSDAMEGEPEYAAGTWTALIRVSQRHDLGLSIELIEQARQQHGPTPELAITRAIEAFRKDNSDQNTALRIFDQWMAAADKPDVLSWQLAKARLERAIEPTRAQAIWGALLERFPEEQLIRVQILQDEINWRADGLTLIRRVLDEMPRDQSGHELATVRTARARLMLMDAESDPELADVASYLLETSRNYPYLSEPYTLLGLCYERQGNRSRALDAYTSAHRIRPGSDALLSSRIRLHRELGEIERANNLIAQYAEQLANSVSADPARLAQTFAMVGDLAQAIQWAERAIQKDVSDRRSALLLARLYLATGREADAERVYQRLLDSPDLNTIIAAASFYIQTGRQDQGAALVARLDELGLEDATKSVVKGHFDLTAGDLDSAMVHYQKAADRGDAVHATTAFVRLITIRISQGDLNGVMQIAKAAASKLPGEERFRAIVDNELLIRSVYDPTTAPFLRRLLVNPDQRPVVEAALRLVRDMAGLQRADAGDEQGLRLLAQLRRLADQNQRLIELQNLLVRRYIAVGQNELAIEIASRSTQMFPKNESVLIAAADANMAAQRWDSAAQVGNQIAELNPSYQAAADIVAARAALRRGLPNEALRLMRPYLELAEQVPNQYGPVIRVHVAAMIAANRKPQALAGLKPVVSGRDRWRVYVLDQIIQHDTTTFATAEAWIGFVMAGEESVADEAVQMNIKAATAWHITGIRDPAGRGSRQANAILASLAGNPQAALQAVLFKAIFAEERGDLDDAEQGYRRVLDQQPENLIALNNLSMVLVKLGRPDAALPFAERAVSGAPRLPLILDTLANAQLAAGQTADAESTIERAISLDPKGVPWHITLCRALMARQDPAAATEALQAYEHIGELINASDQIDASLSQEYLSLRAELDQLLGTAVGSPALRE